MDRLQEIKERHNNPINSFVDGDDIDWLIEQVEKQKYNLYSDFVNKIEELEKEIERLQKRGDEAIAESGRLWSLIYNAQEILNKR